MAFTWAQAYKAIEPVARDHFGLETDEDEVGKRILEEFFDTESTDEPIMDVQEWGGPGAMSFRTEGERIKTDTIYQGTGKRFAAQTYAGGIEITQEAAEDAVKNLPAIKEAGRILGEMARKTPEYLAAQFMDRAFNASYPAFGNGTSLCNTAQVLPRGGTFANMFVGAQFSLSEYALEQAYATLTTMPGSSGMISPRKASKLLVHSSNAITGWKLANTELQVGSGNNDRSFVAGSLDAIVSNPYFGSTTRWFLTTDLNKRGNGLNWKWRIKPEFRSDNEMLLQYKLFITRFRAYWFCKNPRAIFGSNAV